MNDNYQHATGWFEIVEVPTYNLDEVTGSNDEYIYKSSSRVSHLFNNTCLRRYPVPHKFAFDNIYEFKIQFTPLLKYLYIDPVLTTIKNQQANTPVERVKQVILNMLVTKDLANKVFYYINPLGKTLASITWAIRDFYHRTIQTTIGIDVFVRDMIFNLVSVADWKGITAGKQQQADIYNVQENAQRVMYDYAIGDLVYVDMIGIVPTLDYKKYGPCSIT